MIYKVEFKEIGHRGTWETRHFRAQDFPALLKKVFAHIGKSRIKLTVKSIEETDLKVS